MKLFLIREWCIKSTVFPPQCQISDIWKLKFFPAEILWRNKMFQYSSLIWMIQEYLPAEHSTQLGSGKYFSRLMPWRKKKIFEKNVITLSSISRSKSKSDYQSVFSDEGWCWEVETDPLSFPLCWSIWCCRIFVFFYVCWASLITIRVNTPMLTEALVVIFVQNLQFNNCVN